MTQELMGHASPVTTAGYAAFSPGRAVDVVAAVPLPGRKNPGETLKVAGDAADSRTDS
jgi:hypothetical protein